MQQANKQAAAEDEDQWVDLDNPDEVFEGMVPDRIRFDETAISLPPANTLDICNDGDDDRAALRHMLAAPNRWLCKLQVAYVDPDTGAVSYTEGSGLLIADQFVLTAAHVLMDAVEDDDGKFLRAIDAGAVVVIPGLNGRRRRRRSRAADTMPFGWSQGTAFRTNSLFRSAMQKSGRQFAHLDYAVIKLAAPIGRRRFKALKNRRLGNWGVSTHRGRTRIRVLSPKRVKNVKVNAVGYPGDKCMGRPRRGSISQTDLSACRSADRGSVPWYSFDRVRSAGSAPAIFAQLTLDHDVAPGMSGGPVWLRWKGVRNLIGINHACTLDDDDNVISSSATRITDRVKRDITAWVS
ncbi:serine protease [Pelagibius sp. Alg239-R121]|uniref:trypsin-like serine peptidase n=1 Tax=Pelagibius sp. Alg239-R121 TaxID=2993448 RepID=UPI0024A6E357|nr:trypsin-like peptidase domain-containing protein [Pelagibius sp. Alg239-R121]